MFSSNPLRSSSFKFRPYPRLVNLILALGLIAGFLSPVFVRPAKAAGTPALLAPASGVTVTATGAGGTLGAPPAAIPDFSWTAVEGAKEYRLQFSQDIAFTNKVEHTTSQTRFTPTEVGQFNDGLWFWRVRVESPTASDFSGSWQFTRQWASPDNAPVLVSPIDGSSLEFYTQPAFSWQPVAGAASYRIQIATAEDFGNLRVDQVTLATTFQPRDKLPNGDYFWRVIPINPANREGTRSLVRRFVMRYNQVPALIEPADDSFPTFTPTFRWKAVPGVQYYRLQYSTDPTFNTAIVQVDTNNTTYTPHETLPNDKNYYWRVRSHSGQSISEWSESWNFTKQWYLQPVLLTPVKGFGPVRFPFFSWSTVPGASYYRIELDCDTDFVGSFLTRETANPFYTPDNYSEGFCGGSAGIRYWRVTPFDGSGKPGKASLVSQYRSDPSSLAPTLVSPLFYYPPQPGVNPQEDRTAGLPVFTWHRLFNLDGSIAAEAYRLQVASDSNFNTIIWTVDTENTSAVPTSTVPFQAGQDYYWRVLPLDAFGAEIGQVSQAWKARIDPASAPSGTSGPTVQLLRPEAGFEMVENTPLFEWYPLQGADLYQIEVSQDPSFTTSIISVQTPYPAYIPTAGLAQRSLSKLDFSTYYWRVRARQSGAWTAYTEPSRFQLASGSQWRETRALGNPANRIQLASDPPADAPLDFDLTNLYAAQSKDYWFFGFNASGASSSQYILYLDIDHKDGSGATYDAEGYSVTAIAGHRPEYAVYITKSDGLFTTGNVMVYAWNGIGWNPPVPLDFYAGEVFIDGSHVELQLPYAAIGMEDTTGSYAVALFSAPLAGGNPVDSVPADPGIPGGLLSRFSSVSERLNLVAPLTNATGDPRTLPTMLPTFWDYPAGAPWAGVNVRVYRDKDFTNQVGEYTLKSNVPYYDQEESFWDRDFQGDNTYYWRARPRYLVGVKEYFGAWSTGWRFERQGFIPQHLVESVTDATPTFSWDRVEGAESYLLEVDNDPKFGSPEVSRITTENSYTPTYTLNNGKYHWRVTVRRWGGIQNEYSPSKNFTLSLPTPAGLSPDFGLEGTIVRGTPTLCWADLLSPKDGPHVLSAYRYRVQISKGDPTFSLIYEAVETENRCWTPTQGYHDGEYHWRVAMLDGQNRPGDYSPAARFTKQYPASSLVSPLGPVSGTPTFSWNAVAGAAAYRLEIALNPAFAPLVESITTNAVRFTPTRVYSGSKYYWRVAPVDKDGKLGPFSDAELLVDGPQPDPSRKNNVYLPVVTRK